MEMVMDKNNIKPRHDSDIDMYLDMARGDEAIETGSVYSDDEPDGGAGARPLLAQTPFRTASAEEIAKNAEAAKNAARP
jgi:hypothetical protein